MPEHGALATRKLSTNYESCRRPTSRQAGKYATTELSTRRSSSTSFSTRSQNRRTTQTPSKIWAINQPINQPSHVQMTVMGSHNVLNDCTSTRQYPPPPVRSMITFPSISHSVKFIPYLELLRFKSGGQ
ncbi:hypothetical protein AC579_6286 [Pseudocercospora musae]|uniref:Uncharacterized protein n=1 Tax=Pseudocercospora musae TaxID=113226 RepID=A0A139IP27_9PEZI|nr:hypothetical protein AC579_6286 [Pseudocercospora musae]